MRTESESRTGRLRFSLRVLLIVVFIAAVVSAWTAARLKKMRTEERIAATCLQLGATISLTDDDRGWITGLHFSRPTNLNDEHLRELAKLEHLEVLWLSQTQVTGDGLEALEQFPALRELHVNESQLTPEGILHLKQLDQLEKIQFWGLPLNDPRGEQILKTLPNVQPN